MKLRKRGNFSRWGALSALLAVICAGNAFATEWNVSTVAALTNAVTQAMSGDRIILAQGKYTFNDEWMQDEGTGRNLLVITNDNITIEGAVATPRSTWTDHDEPVVIDGNGIGSILKVDQSNRSSQKTARNRVMLKNITFTGASYQGVAFATGVKVANYDFVTCTNCVFRQNTISSGSGMINWGEIDDCFVTNNTVGSSSLYILRNLNAYGCDIVGNSGSLWDALTADRCTVAYNESSRGLCYKGTGSRAKYTNCVFKFNTVANRIIDSSNSLIDCTFEGNTNTAGYAMFCGTVATNCVFRKNVSKAFVLAENFASLCRCRFEENIAMKAGVYLNAADMDAVVDDCTFVSNRLDNAKSANYGGSAIRVQRDASHLCTMVVTGSTFAWNEDFASGSIDGVICAINDVVGEDPWAAITVVDSAFATNRAAVVSGVRGVRARRCVFAGNASGEANTFRGTAWNSSLEDCDIVGGGISDSVVDRCRIHDASDEVSCLFSGYTRATNCIVERCSPNSSFGCLYYIGTGFRMDAEFVNCTFATNRMSTYRVASTCSATNGVLFANCLFNGNWTYAYTRLTDISVVKPSASTYNPEWLNDYTVFSNTFYGRFATGTGNQIKADQFATFTNAPNTLACCENPRFAKDKYPDAPYWSLLNNSPLVGAGDPMGFTAEDIDLAGRPRIRDGKIDIGCYQCWLKTPGLIISVH